MIRKRAQSMIGLGVRYEEAICKEETHTIKTKST
jgi:hypothetical protein